MSRTLVTLATLVAGAAFAPPAPAKDSAPPKAPRDIAVTATTASSVSLAWSPAKDNKGVVGYGVYRDGALAASAPATTVTIGSLDCERTYRFGVDAVDGAGNRSKDQATVTATTARCPPAGSDLFVSPGGADYRWSFLAATYDGSTVRLYVDGALVATHDAPGGMTPSHGALRIGGNTIWNEWFSGAIDNVRIYARALSASELAADRAAPVTAAAPAPSSAGLVAAYAFDEGTGGTTADLSGNGNAGRLENTGWTTGRFGGALSFDGADSMVSVADSPSLDLTNAMTLEAWVRPSALGGSWRTAILKEAGTHLDYALYANATDLADPAPTSGTPSGHVYVGADTWAKGPDTLPASDCRSADDPCLTLDRAYHAAQGGQVVWLEPGAYPEQWLSDDPTKTGLPVVVRQQRPGTATVAGLEVHAGRLVFDGLDLADTYWETWVEAHDVVFRNVKAGSFTINSSRNVAVIGGSYGPAVDAFAQVAPWPQNVEPVNVLIEGVTFHDMTRATPSRHMQCLEIGAGNGIVVRDSRFTNCNDFDLMIAGWGDVPPPSNILVENNFFDSATEALPGFTAYYSLMTSGYDNTLIRNNSSTMPFALQPDGPWTNVRIVGNVAPIAPWLCNSGAVYSHNVWDGATCGPTDVNAPSGFVDAAHFDLHLAPGSAAIDAGDPASFPATDIDGDRRPLGRAPDAGADERN